MLKKEEKKKKNTEELPLESISSSETFPVLFTEFIVYIMGTSFVTTLKL